MALDVLVGLAGYSLLAIIIYRLTAILQAFYIHLIKAPNNLKRLAGARWAGLLSFDCFAALY